MNVLKRKTYYIFDNSGFVASLRTPYGDFLSKVFRMLPWQEYVKKYGEVDALYSGGAPLHYHLFVIHQNPFYWGVITVLDIENLDAIANAIKKKDPKCKVATLQDY